MDMYSEPETFQETILALALERMAAGESRAVILAEAGADAEWLEPLLGLASAVHELREVTPVPPAEASLSRFLAQAERMRPAPGPSGPAPRRWWEGWRDALRLPSLALPRLAAALASVVLAIFALTLGAALFLGSPATAAAQNVLPGQWSYPLKRLGEEIYLRLPQSGQSRSATSAEYDGRRRDEVRALLEGRLAACVTFRGQVEGLDVAQAVVDGIALQLVDETRIEGPLAVGAQAFVEACSQPDGVLVAEHIVVEQPAQPTATPSPTATAQPTFTATATPQPTPTSSPMPMPTEVATEAVAPEPMETPTDEPTELPAETPTREPEASATPSLAPTQETPELETPELETPELPDEGGNQNDNADDNGNDGNDNAGGGDNDNDNGGGDNDNDGGDHTDDNSGDNDNSGGDDNANAADSDENTK